MNLPLVVHDACFRVYSILKGTNNYRFIYYWGAFETVDEAIREKQFAEDAVFTAWIVTGEFEGYEKERIKTINQHY